jgi:hypothetical protein
MEGPNPAAVAVSIVRSLLRMRRPAPIGVGHGDTGELAQVLCAVGSRGPKGLHESAPLLDGVISTMALTDPDQLGRDGALAFWLDLYNAGALALAARAAATGEASVLRVPGAFSAPFVTVAREALSMDAIEHAKIRRFGDPRIHAALVCGSISCPTLRPTPYSGTDLDVTLDDQMRTFLQRGGLSIDRGASTVHLSRVFSWYGADFARPRRMPTFVPASRRRVLAALKPWTELDTAEWIDGSRPAIEFQSYDWGLRCTLG